MADNPAGDDPVTDGGPEGSEADDLTPESGLDRVIEEGRRRLGRRWPAMITTGLVGGIDVGTGVLALLLVEHETHSKLLGGLAFSIGFIALTLARSELFTEDFLVPVTTVIAGQARLWRLGRLWGVTLVANLAGGWIVTVLVIVGFPELEDTAVASGAHYVDLGVGWRSFALALLGGLVITLMTWMQHTTDALGGRLVAAITAAFLLAAGPLNHAIINSLLLFAGLHAGADYSYADWAVVAGWAALGNIVGGIGLVTMLRVLQAPERVRAARNSGDSA